MGRSSSDLVPGDSGFATDDVHGASDLIVDPLLNYLNDEVASPSHRRRAECPHSPSFRAGDAVEALKTRGYYHIPSVLTPEECDEALERLWDFVEDASGGCVRRSDPTTWYPRHEVRILRGESMDHPVNGTDEGNSVISGDRVEHDDFDPWPHTGYSSFPDMFQSLGAGYVLGDVRERLAERIFEPLFGTRELLCSKEGFTFCRPLIAKSQKDTLVWKSQDADLGPRARPVFRVCGRPQPLSEGEHYDQGVPLAALQYGAADHRHANVNAGGSSKNQQKRNQRKLDSRRRLKDLAGLCHVQASVSFTDQALDERHGGGHFLCYPRSHSDVHRELVGGTYRATPQGAGLGDGRADPTWVPLTDGEIRRLGEMGCPASRIFAGRGDVILWRSDLVHAGVTPSLTANLVRDDEDEVKYDGPREFRAVGYCGMLPVQAVRDYSLYSLPRQKLKENGGKHGQRPRSNNINALSIDPEKSHRMLQAREDELLCQKLESYRTGRTGDHRPDVEAWHEHRRTTMWNTRHRGIRHGNLLQQEQPHPLIPPRIAPRMLQRPRFRLGAPALTLRQAELYGLLPYRRRTDDAGFDELVRRKDIERAVVRGVRFVEGAYEGTHLDGEKVGPWRMVNGQFCSKGDRDSVGEESVDVPICLASMERSTCSVDGVSVDISGQDKYLGGMASPCGRYIYGVPGHAKRVVRVNVRYGGVDFIGPEFPGEFKWLRGVEVPGHVMGRRPDGSLAYPSGCCLALPCNSKDGCVLKIDPETSKVTTFVTGPPISDVEGGWLYHGGDLSSDGFVYAIPANAPRVMKIDPRAETTEYIGPEYHGKAKWYGGITGSDGCIYGIPHNSTGVLRINPKTQEVTILGEGTLPEGRWKWHGGLASSDGSKIIGFPNNADSVLVINVNKQNGSFPTVYNVGDSSILRSGYHRVPQDGRYKYLGGALTSDGKLAYLFPCDAEYVLRFDMETDEMKLVGPHLTEGENKFQNGFTGADGCIYAIPQRASGVLRIIPPGVKRYGSDGNVLSAEKEYVDVIYCGDGMVSCKDKFEGGVLGLDGKIYCIPLRAKMFVNIIPGKE